MSILTVIYCHIKHVWLQALQCLCSGHSQQFILVLTFTTSKTVSNCICHLCLCNTITHEARCTLWAKEPLSAEILYHQECSGPTIMVFSVYKGFDQNQKILHIPSHAHPKHPLKAQNDPWQWACNVRNYPAFQYNLVSLPSDPKKDSKSYQRQLANQGFSGVLPLEESDEANK